MTAKLSLFAGKFLAGICILTIFFSFGNLSAEDGNTATAGGKGNRPRTADPRAAKGATSPSEAMQYHGGRVMQGAVRMYYIWYGNWDAGSKSILTNFANGIGGSPYFNINEGYTHGSDTGGLKSLSYAGSATDNYSLGTSLSDANIGTIVSNALANGSLPTDANGVYFVLTSADVTETSGFPAAYCGWHASGTLNGSNIRYAFVGDASKLSTQACAVQTAASPNENPAADAMASLIANELNEAVTDPDLDAWYDSAGQENADKCAWTFGSTYALPNGSMANVNLGGRDYLLQQNWVNTAGGYCGLSPLVSDAVSVPPQSIKANAVVHALVSGSLSGTSDSSTAAANLTLEGTGDWMHWGDASLNRKAGVPAQLSNYRIVGGGGALTYSNDPKPLSWTDGTPSASSANNLKGIYINGAGRGFSLTAPADTNARTLIVHLGGWNSSGTLVAHLSDSSAPDYTNTTTVASGQYDRAYTLTYQASGLGQSLTVTWKMASGAGNVTLTGAALTGPGIVVPSITATAGGSQSTPISTGFPVAFQATVKDAGNNPISGAAVTFTAPASGASGTFGGPVTVNTDASGIATAPAFTANTIVGSYNVVASTPGAASSASFGLTNQVGPPASVTTTGGTPQGATVNAAFSSLLVATVKDAGGNPVSGATVTFTAPGSGASGTFTGGATTADVLTVANGTATAPSFTANGQTGSYVVTASVAAFSANFNLTNNAVLVGGSLSGVGDGSAAAANLTTEGNSDWVHWGDASLSRKAGVAAQLSNYTVVGGGSVLTYSNDPRPLSWTDGTPTASSANNLKGIFVTGVGNGFSVTAPADTTTRTLTVHVGGWNSGGTLTAHLSDGVTADFTHTTSAASGAYDRNYTLSYAAASSGRTLTVRWQMTSTAPGINGNVTLNGVALSGASVPTISITATGGALQSTAISTAFPSSLQATVKDSNSNPVSGAAVTFSAPASGASGTFSGSATVNTDASGIATAPAFTANSVAGSYGVTASTPGAPVPASFSLTNQVGSPASVIATSGTPQSAVISTAFANLLVATVKDSGGNLVSGVTMTFTAPGSGASGTFTGGLTTANVVTSANGTATAPSFTANGQTGGYTVTASVGGPGANFNLTNTAVPVAGSLSGAGDSSTAAANLTAEGHGDWVHWGDASLNRKAGVTAQLSSYTIVGGGGAQIYSNDPRALSWTDGTPSASGTNNFNGLFISGTGKGFSITAPADTGIRTIVLHVGGWNSGGTLTAHLSDTSAPDFTNVTSAASGAYDRNYTLTYKAGAAGQSLILTWKMSAGSGNVTLNGAALSVPSTANITATGGGVQSTTISSDFPSALQATVKDNYNNPVNGAAVTFTAPATGASGTFGDQTAVTVNTDANGVATSPAFTANAIAGVFTIAASTPGAGSSASYSLTNQAGPPAGITATSGTPQTATINTAFAAPLVATVKDLSGNPVSGVTVTFTAPDSGATGTFTGGLAAATAVTAANGTATAPSFTANGEAGGYVISATAPGVPGSASFNLTNTLVPPTVIKLVQHNNENPNINMSPTSSSFKSNNTAGNWIAVLIRAGSSSTQNLTVTDTNGNIYHPALIVGQTENFHTSAIFYAENIKGGANTVNVYPSTPGYIRLAILEYSGVAKSNSLDVALGAQGKSAVANSGNLTPSENGELVIGLLGTGDASMVTGGNGFTIEENVPVGGTKLMAEDKIQTLASTTSAVFSFSSDTWTAGIAAFKVAH